MNSNLQSQEIEVVAKLMELIESIETKGNNQPTLNFVFNSCGVGPYGKKESQWEARVLYPTYEILDYGYTLEQAAERLLDRLLYPEKYPDED